MFVRKNKIKKSVLETLIKGCHRAKDGCYLAVTTTFL